MKRIKKVLIAVGGTGGHLFPAQGFAEEAKKAWGADVIFAGKGLSSNNYFDRERFEHYEIDSMTPFRKKALVSLYRLFKGISQSVLLLSRKKPCVVVGFGSFHSFPLLIAAKIKRVPLVLFESNAMPGKVVRLFSKRALVTAIYLQGAKNHLKGKVQEVAIPLGNRLKAELLSKEEARKKLGLQPDKRVILVFGGSQGARGLNEVILESLPKLDIQLIHLTGSEEMQKKSEALCQKLGISCYVRVFEKQMNLVMQAADVAICRAGAMTIAELLHHQLPSILVPYPYASDDHQKINALFLEEVVQGAKCLLQKDLTAEKVIDLLSSFFALSGKTLDEMRESLASFQKEENLPTLATLIEESL